MTKWVKAKALQRITEKDYKNCFNDFVVMRFDIPQILISDNGLQFIGKEFGAYLKELNHTQEVFGGASISKWPNRSY